MMYTMPYNADIQGRISAQPSQEEIDRWWQLVRLGLTNRGYVVNNAYFGPGGEVVIDADRDPTADWIGANVPNKTPREQTEDSDLTKAQATLTKLQAGTATPAAMQQVLAFLLQAELDRRGIGS